MATGVTKILIEIRVVGITHKQIGTKKQALLEWMHDERHNKYLEYSKMHLFQNII